MDARAYEATLRATVFPTAGSVEQLAAFLLVARRYGLDPITREIYAFPTKAGGVQPVVGIDGWLNLGNSRPEFNGMEFEDHLDDGKVTRSLAACIVHGSTDRSHRHDRAQRDGTVETVAGADVAPQARRSVTLRFSASSTGTKPSASSTGRRLSPPRRHRRSPKSTPDRWPKAAPNPRAPRWNSRPAPALTFAHVADKPAVGEGGRHATAESMIPRRGRPARGAGRRISPAGERCARLAKRPAGADVFLTPPDLQRLTGRTRYTAQRRALDRLGIRYTVAATGEPMVRAEAIDGKPGPARGPRWDRIAA
jgi:hypothetical protein